MVRGNNKAIPAKPKPLKGPRSRREAEKQQSAPASNLAFLELAQKCLNIFRDALKPDFQDAEILQEVKGHLFNRDFAAAFGKDEFLRVYASRWSPSRALGYVEIFAEMQKEILNSFHAGDGKRPYNIACLGGGAGAEAIAVAGWIHLQNKGAETPPLFPDNINARFIDIAAWEDVITNLHKDTVTPPELSKYASAAVKDANVALLPKDAYSASFQQLDVLEMQEEQTRQVLGDIDLVTMMFTLNELYATSMPKTQHLLENITSNSRPGAHLLVVDSPGSYSTVSINGTEKKYPMQWLLDYTLIGALERKGSRPKWEKVISNDSKWFRMPQELKYPIELENMRYQVHLYRKLADSDVP